jgi:thiol-disulfide isomerase/thioredoxin
MALKQILPLLVLTFSWALTSTNANGQQFKREGYLISGAIKGIDSGRVRMLSANGSSILDSALIVRGKFSMQGKIGMPERLLFNISPGNWNFRAFVEDTSIKLFVDTTGAQHQGKGTNKWALIWEIEETGSAIADVYTQYKKETNQKYYVSIISSLREKLKAVKGNTDAEAKVTREMDSVNNLLLASQKAWIESYIHQYPSSIAGVYLFNEYFQTYQYYQPSPDISFSYLDSILNRFSEVATTSVYYKELSDKANNLRSIQPGNLAPDFTLLQRDKSKFTLSSTRGKYTLIDFWASWCVPCRRAIPLWKEVYDKYNNKEFTIVGVSSDRRWNDWINALKKEQMPWVQVIDEFPNESDPALVTKSFGTNGLPFYVLLDKEGKVIVSSNDKDVVKEKIEEIFQ